jgi:hypothetical protein
MFDTLIAPRTYLIVMKEVLIAQDLALTIADYDTNASIIIASTHAEAEAALATVNSLEMAFVANAPSQFKTSMLARTIRQRNGRVVLLGSEAEEVGPTQCWEVLNQPFSTDAVLKLLD